MNIVVVDSFAADQGAPAWGPLSELGSVATFPRTTPAQLLERAGAAEAILTNKVVFDATTLAQLPRLRYIGIVATGANIVDLAACRERGITVTNVPGYSTHSVAQLVFASLLHHAQNVAGHNEHVKRGDWANSPDFMFTVQPISELAGKTLTVLGFGAIGKAVAKIAEAFGMRVLIAAVPGSPSSDRVPLEAALRDSDVVSLHCPLTQLTRQMVNDAFVAQMKPGAVLVNTGRGALVDEAALVRGLANGRLGAVLLDVLEREPPDAANPLLDANAPWARRVVVTPHIGWATVEARERLIDEAIQNVAAFVRGEMRNRL